MLWIDRNFDYNDELAHKYMKYKGKYYDVGTICKIKGRNGPKLVRFMGWHFNNNRWNFELVDKNDYGLYDSYDRAGVSAYCLEIVKPVYPNLMLTTSIQTDNRDKPSFWNIEVAWVWYIAIMVVTVIFKERIGLWILESVVFFGWKEGIFKGGKKK